MFVETVVPQQLRQEKKKERERERFQDLYSE